MKITVKKLNKKIREKLLEKSIGLFYNKLSEAEKRDLVKVFLDGTKKDKAKFIKKHSKILKSVLDKESKKVIIELKKELKK